MSGEMRTESGAVEQPLAQRKPMRLSWHGWLALGLILAAGLAWLAYHLLVGRYEENTNNAYIRADQVAISSKLAGYVTGLSVRDNQMVAAGSELVRIDPQDYRDRVDAANAAVTMAGAHAEAAAADASGANALVVQLTAELAAAEAAAAYQQGEVARYQPLVKSGAESSATLAQWTLQRNRALAEVKSLRARLVSARSQIASAEARRAAASATVQAERVHQRSAAHDLEETRLIAPIAGQIAARSVRLGQYVQPGQRLMTIVPVDSLYVEANFKETQIRMMRPGQPAEIRVDALPGLTFHGVVESVTPGTGASFSLVPPQNATGNFTKIVQRVPVRIRLTPGPLARKVLVPGLSLDVSVDTRLGKDEAAAIQAELDAARQ
jgi:membrane fusion protein (multidrug efflux system)